MTHSDEETSRWLCGCRERLQRNGICMRHPAMVLRSWGGPGKSGCWTHKRRQGCSLSCLIYVIPYSIGSALTLALRAQFWIDPGVHLRSKLRAADHANYLPSARGEQPLFDLPGSGMPSNMWVRCSTSHHAHQWTTRRALASESGFSSTHVPWCYR